MSGTLEDLVQYRLEKANQTLEDAKLLANAKRWNPCVNRLYYACFYAVTALLAQNEFSSGKHTGIRSLFNLNFIKTGKIPKEIAEIYNDLFDRRQEGDYADFVVFNEDQVLPRIIKTANFIKTIALFLKNK
ncbi:MAG: HEPN domain-containing protein [Chitinivibrionales bacterium]|nr:HEPN domain-containing protein [Chitinivibrionales bacterium]